MLILRNRYIPFKGFSAINLFGALVVHPGVMLSETLIRHERIHTAQMREMLYIPFYVWYGCEWLVRTLRRRSGAYYRLSMEREAYDNQHNPNYLKQRRHYAWLRYLRR